MFLLSILSSLLHVDLVMSPCTEMHGWMVQLWTCAEIFVRQLTADG